MSETNEPKAQLSAVPLDCRVSGPLRDAERSIGLAVARLGQMGPGGGNAWIGAWGEYKRLSQLMIKTRALADKIERQERNFLSKRKPTNT
jgi:hypothetical protein